MRATVQVRLDRQALPALNRAGATRHDSELLGEADEVDHRAVRLMPIGSTVWMPALLAGGFVTRYQRRTDTRYAWLSR